VAERPDGEDPRLPGLVEHRLVRLGELDRTHVLHAAQVVNPVHPLSSLELPQSPSWRSPHTGVEATAVASPSASSSSTPTSPRPWRAGPTPGRRPPSCSSPR